MSFEVASIKPVTVSGEPRDRVAPNGLSVQSRLADLIEDAYGVEPYQVVAGPGWARTDYYEVLAKTSAVATAIQIRQMTQTLLAERFGLKIHRETRLVAGFVLTTDRGGAKLPTPRAIAPDNVVGSVQIRGGTLWARGATLNHVAFVLSRKLRQPVIDETGINGNFDFKLNEDGQDAEFASVLSSFHDIGLRLEPRKLPVEFIVIDEANRPSAN